MMMWWWVVIPVIIVLALFLFKGRGLAQNKTNKTSMDILDNRFAQGEISKEEYEEQKRTLNSKN